MSTSPQELNQIIDGQSPEINPGGWWLAGGWWLVAGGWWLVAGGWWLVAGE